MKALEESNHDQREDVLETTSATTLEPSNPEQVHVLVTDDITNPTHFTMPIITDIQ